MDKSKDDIEKKMDEEDSSLDSTRPGRGETLLLKLIDKVDKLAEDFHHIKSERFTLFAKTDFLLKEVEQVKSYVRTVERRTYHTEFKVKDAEKIYEDTQYIRRRFKEEPYLLDPEITVGDIVEVMVDEENARMIGERGLVVSQMQHLKTLQFDYPRRCIEYNEKNLKKIGIEPSKFRRPS